MREKKKRRKEQTIRIKKHNKRISSFIPSTAELKAIAYDSVIATLGTVVFAYAVKKLLGEKMGVPMTPTGMWLAVAIAGGMLITNLLKQKGVIPEESYRKKKK